MRTMARRVMPLLGVWPGLLLTAALAVGGCKRDSPDAAPNSRSSTAPATQGSAPTPPGGAPAKNPTATAMPAKSVGDDVPVELPARPKPPELRNDAERADASKILAGYGFPAHPSLTPLCGWRDFNPGGTTWVVDLFTSPLPAPQLRRDLIKRLGDRGLEGATWSIPDSGAVERQLSLLSPEDLARYPRCKTTPPADAQTLIVARRAR
jgi:hypothetical protein